VAVCHSFCLFFIFSNSNIQSSNHIHTIHSPRPLSISSSLVSSVGQTSLWCRAENRTRACLPASRRATNCATPHHRVGSHRAPTVIRVQKLNLAFPHGELGRPVGSTAGSHCAPTRIRVKKNESHIPMWRMKATCRFSSRISLRSYKNQSSEIESCLPTWRMRGNRQVQQNDLTMLL
jgi:hypothetical protein